MRIKLSHKIFELPYAEISGSSLCKNLLGAILRRGWIKTYEISFFYVFGIYIENKNIAQLFIVRIHI